MSPWAWSFSSGRALSLRGALVFIALGFSRSVWSEEPAVRIQDADPTGAYPVGGLVGWTLTGGDPLTPWTVEAPGVKTRMVAQGTVGQGPIRVPTNEAMWLRLRIAMGPGRSVIERGAITGPETWDPAQSAPQDFDAFWQREMKALGRIPPRATLRQESRSEGIICWEMSVPQVDGRQVRGWLASPEDDRPLPAVLICQYAGVYPLGPGAARAYAKQGWMALNISAHDLPLRESAEFYRRQEQGPLKGYPAIGSGDPRSSYFRTMFLGCVQAARVLMAQSQWNGVLLVTGTSQGGLQALATAALVQQTTATVVLLPAGCDTLAQTQGRVAGWPYWHAFELPPGVSREDVLQTSRYFDGAHFAARAHGAVLAGYGLLDTTSPPTAVLAMLNQVPGRSVGVPLPQVSHHNHVRPEAFEQERQRWELALVGGRVIPPALGVP